MARSLLYRSRFLQPNTHFLAFCDIYKICTPSHLWNPKWKTTWRKTSRKIPKKTKELDPMENSKMKKLQGKHGTRTPSHRSKLKIFAKLRQTFFAFLLEFLQKSSKILIFRQLSSNFALILMIFSRNFAEHSRKCWEVLKFSKFLKDSFKIVIISRILLNSDRILMEFWCSKIRMIRSLGNRIFQPWCRRGGRGGRAARGGRARGAE